jgi:hypothetical protein
VVTLLKDSGGYLIAFRVTTLNCHVALLEGDLRSDSTSEICRSLLTEKVSDV